MSEPSLIPTSTMMPLRRRVLDPGRSERNGLVGAAALHAAVAGLIVGYAWFLHTTGHTWGSASSTASAIQATMVADIPLPPKQPRNEDNVLATDTPSPAPVVPAPKTVDAPRPDAIAIAAKPTKPEKVAEKTTPPPPPHPQPVKVDPTKATTGEATGVRMAMSAQETKAGTVSIGIPDRGFGTRYAFYVLQIKQKVAAQWYTSMLDAQAGGKRVYISFQVERDGSPTHISIEKPSGDNTLDGTALRAVQHIDTFGPLPDGYTGSHINVEYYFEPPAHP